MRGGRIPIFNMMVVRLPHSHTSNTFLIRMFVVFLERTEPASRNANPVCMTETTKQQTVSFATLHSIQGQAFHDPTFQFGITTRKVIVTMYTGV